MTPAEKEAWLGRRRASLAAWLSTDQNRDFAVAKAIDRISRLELLIYEDHGIQISDPAYKVEI